MDTRQETLSKISDYVREAMPALSRQGWVVVGASARNYHVGECYVSFWCPYVAAYAILRAPADVMENPPKALPETLDAEHRGALGALLLEVDDLRKRLSTTLARIVDVLRTIHRG